MAYEIQRWQAQKWQTLGEQFATQEAAEVRIAELVGQGHSVTFGFFNLQGGTSVVPCCPNCGAIMLRDQDVPPGHIKQINGVSFYAFKCSGGCGGSNVVSPI